LLYGSVAPLNRELTELSRHKEVSLSNNSKAAVYQSVLTKSEFDIFRQSLRDKTIDLATIFPELNDEFVVSAYRKVLQKTFGHGKAIVESFFTLPNLEEVLKSQTLIILKKSLEFLQSELGFDFENRYASRIGCFEIHNLHNWLESFQPFSINCVNTSPDPKDLSGLYDVEIERAEEVLKDSYRVHLICRNDSDEVFNGLIDLKAGDVANDKIFIEEEFSELEAWVFSNNGEIVHHEHNHYMMEISMGMGIQGRSVNIEDKLSDKAKSLKEKAPNGIATVTRTTTEHSNICYGKNRRIKSHYAMMQGLVTKCFPKNEKDRFFRKTLENEIGVISHLVKIIGDGHTRRAIIVDPFFSEESIIRLVTRISDSTLDLQVVTSWARIDPETGDPYKDKVKPIEKLTRRLEQTRNIINPNLNITNITWKNDQAFHDRYLIVYTVDGKIDAYLLSNSINNMAGNWPFCMSLLSPFVANEVALYAESLCEGRDITRDKDPDITFQWNKSAV